MPECIKIRNCFFMFKLLSLVAAYVGVFICWCKARFFICPYFKLSWLFFSIRRMYLFWFPLGLFVLRLLWYSWGGYQPRLFGLNFLYSYHCHVNLSLFQFSLVHRLFNHATANAVWILFFVTHHQVLSVLRCSRQRCTMYHATESPHGDNATRRQGGGPVVV